MKNCSYCGRDNADETLNCRECGTEFELLGEASLPEKPEPPESSRSPRLLQTSGVLKNIASLASDMADELLARLAKAAIPVEVRTVTQEGGLEYSDILVEEVNYDRACDVAEAWQADELAEAGRHSNQYCPRCGSKRLEYFAADKLGSIWKCKDCGNDFAK